MSDKESLKKLKRKKREKYRTENKKTSNYELKSKTTKLMQKNHL